MRRLLPLAVLLCLSAMAQNPDYFPLQVGNQWIYRGTGVGASSRTIEVIGTTTTADHTYFLVSGFGNAPVQLRRTDDNKLLQLEPATGTERLLEDFSASEKATFSTSVDMCSTNATVESRGGAYNGPIGAFGSEALIVNYTGTCADAGVVKDVFLPWVGLVKRIETSFAGPRVFDLIYTRVGTAMQAAAPLVSFTLALDRQSYAQGDPMMARLTVRSTQNDPLVLQFTSGQEYDLAIQDSDGAEVYRWSKGRMFTEIVHDLTIAGEKNWVIEIKLPAELPAGKYVAQGWLMASGTPKKYSASAGFEITK